MPTLFVNKIDWSMRMSIDSKKLNEVTIKNKYSPPIIDNLYSQLRGLVMFSKINVRSNYYQIRVVEQDLPKIDFQIKYDNFEFVMISFGIISTLIMFMNVINRVFYNC